MARKKRRTDNNETNATVVTQNGGNGSIGLSKAAFDALNSGTYGQLTNRKAKSTRSEDQSYIASPTPVPALKGMSGTNDAWESSFGHVNTEKARKKYAQDYTPIGNKGLSQEDADFLYDVFDRNRLSSGGNSAIVHQLKNNIWHSTKDWEEKYGKSVEQIVDEYAKDFDKISERKDWEKGNKNKVSSTLASVFRGGTVEPALDLESTILGKIAPNSEVTKAVRNATEKYSKEKEQTKAGVTSNMGETGKKAYEFGTGLAEKGLQYANPSKLKYALTLGKTAENERQNLKDRGIEGTKAEVQSGLAGLTDAALDVIGFESIPALKGLTESGNIGKEVLGRFLIGGGEQGLTDVINKGVDRLMNGENSLYDNKVATYIAQGMSEEDAKKQANIDEATELGESIVSGGMLNNIVGLGGKTIKKAVDKIPSIIPPNNNPPSTSDIANRYTDNLSVATRQANAGEFGVKHMDNISENNVKPILDKRGKLTKILNENPQIKRTIDGPLKSAELLDSEMSNLRSQIDNYARGGMKENALFDCGETPSVLKESGVVGNRIMASQNVYDKITMPDKFYYNEINPQKKDVHFHGLGKDGFEKIVKGLNDPAVTLRTIHEGKDSVVSIINYTSDNGTPVLAAVTIGKDGKISDISDVASSGRLTTGHIRGNLDSYLEKKAKEIKYIKGDDNSVSTGFGTTELESSSPKNTLPPSDETVNNVQNDETSNKYMNESAQGNPRLTQEVQTAKNGEVPPEGDEKIRSFSKRGAADETLPDEIRDTLSEDYYRVVHNADTEARANSLFDAENLTQTRSNLDRAVESHDPAAALLSYKLAKAYVDNGDYDAATDVLQNVSAELTRMGQFTQAAKLAMLQNDPMAALRSYMRDLDKLNEWGAKKYKKKWNKLELSQEDIDLINSVQKGDSEGLNAVMDQLNEKFGKQVPANFWDKAVAASKTAMLLNLRTQGRNIVANTAMLPVRSLSDRVSAVGQNIAHLINHDIKVTQSVIGGTAKQKGMAGQIFDSMKDTILGENKMKDSVKSDILSKRQIFNDDFLGRFINEKTNGGLEKLNEKLGGTANSSTMESLQNFTYWLMGDFGDTPFVKKNFVNRLASYMKAQGIDNVDDVPDDAVAIAIEEALKATFKDDNAFSKALTKVKKDTGKFGEVALPFVKTPANLAMRAIDYSPAGLINTFRKLKSGADASRVIDELAKNLTGTAMVYLGYKLKESGILSGNYSDDANEKAWQKQHGMLENAIHVGDNYYTIDWAQPSVTPLILGSVMYDAFNKSDEENAGILNAINSTYKGGLAVANSWLQTSPLQSLTDILGGNSYSDGGIAENVANEIIEFPQRFIPAQLGAAARTSDPVIRDTYSKDNTLTGILGNQYRSAISKIPGLSKTLPASYDTWGNKRTRSDTKTEAFFAQNLNPGQLGNNNPTPLDDEIQRIYDATGNNSVFPRNAGRSINLGKDGTLNLTNEQHSKYQKKMGRRSYSYAESLLNNPDFANLSDDEKAEMLGQAYKLSDEITKEELFDHVTDSSKKLKEIARTGTADDVAKYLLDSSKAKELGMNIDTYQKKSDETPGGIEQYVEDKQAAEQAGFVTKSGTVQTEQYQKAIAKAGKQSQKFVNDLPALNELGLEKSAYYVYANAINQHPDLTPTEFAQTYNEINTNKADQLTQKEMIAFFNEWQFADTPEQELPIVMDYWNTYSDGSWKKVPYVKKDGTWGVHNAK